MAPGVIIISLRGASKKKLTLGTLSVAGGQKYAIIGVFLGFLAVRGPPEVIFFFFFFLTTLIWFTSMVPECRGEKSIATPLNQPMSLLTQVLRSRR